MPIAMPSTSGRLVDMMNSPLQLSGQSLKFHETQSRDSYRFRRSTLAPTHPLPPRPVDLTYTFKTAVCRNFLEGRCTYGNKCWRIHYSPQNLITTTEKPVNDPIMKPSAPRLTKKREVCINFIKNRCYNGDRCHRIHLSENDVINRGVPNEQSEPDTYMQSLMHVFDDSTTAVVKLPTDLRKQKFRRKQTNVTHPRKKYFDATTARSDSFLFPLPRSRSSYIVKIPDHHRTTTNKISEPSEPAAEPANLTVNILGHSKVTFGPGFEVMDVMTGFESRWIFIKNIPYPMSAEKVSTILSRFGQVVDVKFGEWHGTSSMTVKAQFANYSEAVEAAHILNGSKLFDQQIEVRLAVGDASNANGSLKDTSALVEWEAPHRIAYAGYASRSEAESALSACRTPLRGLFVRGNIYHGLPAIGAFNVRFRCLPPDTTVADIEAFGKPEMVMLERPTYLSLDSAIKNIKSLLEEFGRPEFEMVPPPYQDGMVHAWAHFCTPQMAKAAAERLHGMKPNFIGKGFLWAYHMKTVSYKVASDTYDKIEADVVRLRNSWSSEFGNGTFIRCDRKPQPNLPVRILLSGENLKDLGRLKAQFEDIFHGEIIKQDGKPAWDRYFDQPDGKSYLEELERRHPVTVQTDINRRLIILFGPSHKRDVVRTELLRKFDELQRRKVRAIPVPGSSIGLFMSVDLLKLQMQLGPDNVVLDLARRILNVRGDDRALGSVREAVRRVREIDRHPKGLREVMECPVCFGDASSPVTLECGHSWCKGCISAYIVAANDNKLFPLTCLGNDATCPQLLPVTTAHKILPAHDFEAVSQASFLAYVQSRSDEFFYCPTPDCRQIYRSAPENTILQCPECLTRICPRCHVEYHDGLECTKTVNSTDQQFKEWTEKHDVKKCPGCKVPIERAEGCNHMTCTRCHTHTCWVCLATFPNGDGIYGHMRQEHGGIGL